MRLIKWFAYTYCYVMFIHIILNVLCKICMHGKEENMVNFTCLPTQLKLNWNGKLEIIIMKGDEFMSVHETMSVSMSMYVWCVCFGVYAFVVNFSISSTAQAAIYYLKMLKTIVRLLGCLYLNSFPHSSPLDVSVYGDKMLSIRYQFMCIAFRSPDPIHIGMYLRWRTNQIHIPPRYIHSKTHAHTPPQPIK